MAGAAVFYDPDAGGKASNAHVGVIGVGDGRGGCRKPRQRSTATTIDEATIAKAAEAASAEVEAQDDIHASAAYRRALTGTMVERALKSAAS